MATWNSPQPLRLTQTKQVKKKLTNGGEEIVTEFDGFKTIALGEKVPDDLLTAEFIGNALDQLANLSQKDMVKLAQWKEANPRVAWKWDYLDHSPHLLKTIFPDKPSSIATAS